MRSILLLTGQYSPEHGPGYVPGPRSVAGPKGGSAVELPERGGFFHGETALIKSLDSTVPTRAIEELYGDLLARKKGSSPLIGPAKNPVAWQGKGDHGQGGEGMMGGRPYGRAMGMTGEDLRDGLELGKTTIELGPFLPWMMPGLALSLTLQGDVIQQLRCHAL